MRSAAALLILAMAGCVASERVEHLPARDPVTVRWTLEAAKVAPEEEIIGEIGTQGVTRPVTVDDIIALKEGGLSDRLIHAMMLAPVHEPRSAAVRTTVVRSPDWKTIGDIAYGVLYVMAKVGEGLVQCCSCICRR